jgi:hypothetical protein
MRLSSVIGEPGARRVSPLLFLLVILTFFLVFTGVSCNEATTKAALASIDASEGVSGSEGAQVTACVNALSGGEHPHVQRLATRLRTGPGDRLGPGSVQSEQRRGPGHLVREYRPATPRLSRAGERRSWTPLRLRRVSRRPGGEEPRPGRGHLRRRLGACCWSSTSFHVRDLLVSKISASEGSSVPGIDPSSLFDINVGTGRLIALVILAVLVLVNVSALFVRVPPTAVATPEPPEPPPPRPSPP